jgi:hypothetical protein
MSGRGVLVVQVAWVAATLALMAAWRAEALVLLTALPLVGPLLREVAPSPAVDERQRLEEYRASHLALMAVYALLFLTLVRLQAERGGWPGEWLLLLVLPLVVRAGVSIGRGSGAARLGLVMGVVPGLLWLGFSVLSHGLTAATLSEAWIGGGLLALTAAAWRWPRAGGVLLVLLATTLLVVFVQPLVAQARWAQAGAMLLALVAPPLLAGIAFFAAGTRRPPRDEFADLREASDPVPPPRASRHPRMLGRRGLLAVAALFAGGVAAVTALGAMPGAPAARGDREAGESVAGQRRPDERLSGEREIDGVPCTGRVTYGDNGQLSACTLARDHVFAGGPRLPRGTRFGLDAAGHVTTAFLPATMLIDGHACFGDGSHDPMTAFHPNGRLKFCNLAAPAAVQGVPCDRSTFWKWMRHGGAGLALHDNGTLHDCLAAAEVTVGGRHYRRGEHVVLDRDGVPASQ